MPCVGSCSAARRSLGVAADGADFIVGFDAERRSVAGAMVECIEQTAIPVAMVGLLYALPNTGLYRRLSSEGRLHQDADRAAEGDADQTTSGLNFETLRPRAAVLADYREVIERIYEPRAFFGRVSAWCARSTCAGIGCASP